MTSIAGIITHKSIDTHVEINKMLKVMALPRAQSEVSPLAFDSYHIGISTGIFASNSKKTLFLGISGQIFNKGEIQEKLKSVNLQVKNDQLEELLLLAYECYGTDFFKLLDGSFVIVILDNAQQKLLIARDRLGSKTFFWGEWNNTFLFASELKGILSSNLVPQSPDFTSISSYLFLGYFPQDKTPIRHINRLLPGYYMEINSSGAITINKFWSFKKAKNTFDFSNPKEAYQELDRLLLKATQKRIETNTNFSCLLQDHIGSSALAHYLRKSSSQMTQSFSATFEGESRPSQKNIERQAASFNFNHTNYQINADSIFTNLQQMIWHLDEPIADPNSVAIFTMVANASRGTKVCFSSLGSHEFLGNPMASFATAYEPAYLWLLFLAKPLILKGVAPIMSKINKRASLHMLRYFQSDFCALEYLKGEALFSQKSLRSIAPDLSKLFDVNQFLEQSYQYLNFVLYQDFNLQDYLFFDATTTLSNCLLIQHEKLFSAHQMQLHSPYLDKEVLEFLSAMPPALKYRGYNEALPLREILKEAQKTEPNGNFYSKNPNFLSHWLNQPKVRAIFNILPYGVLAESNIIDGKNLKKMLKSSLIQKHQFERLWAILVLEIWFYLFVNNPIYTYPTKDMPLEDFIRSQKLLLLR